MDYLMTSTVLVNGVLNIGQSLNEILSNFQQTLSIDMMNSS